MTKKFKIIYILSLLLIISSCDSTSRKVYPVSEGTATIDYLSNIDNFFHKTEIEALYKLGSPTLIFKINNTKILVFILSLATIDRDYYTSRYIFIDTLSNFVIKDTIYKFH